MIDFVLQELRKVPQFSRASLLPFSLKILIAHGNVSVPLHLHEDRQETQTSVPDHDSFRTTRRDFWVYEGPRLFARKPEENHALCNSDLRCSNAPPVSGCIAPEGERVGQIADQRADFWSSCVWHCRADLTKRGVSELPNSANRHSCLQ